MFEVLGPFEIIPSRNKVARRIEKDCSGFWQAHPKANAARNRIGCYVFAIRAAKGYRPVYVGKTWNGFAKEIFGSHQRDYYNAELASIAKGTPVFFFVTHPAGRGKPNKRMIRDIEEFLIQVAVAKNPNVRNVIGRSEKKWGITGVIRSGQGKAKKSATEFKKTMGME